MEEKRKAARKVAEILQTQLKSNLDDLFFRTLHGVVFSEDGEVRPEIWSQEDVQANLRKEFPRLVPLVALGWGVHQSSTSALNCCDQGDIDGGYLLARAMVERAINFAYLEVCDDEAFQEWQDHSVQKAFRLLKRNMTVGDVSVEIPFPPTPELSSLPEMEALIQQFTGKSGRENTRWSKLNLDERLAYVESNADSPKGAVGLLMTALLSVYEIGAEAQHGSLFGVAVKSGLFMPSGMNKSFHHTAIQTAIIECGTATILVLAHMAKRPDWKDTAMLELVKFVNDTNDSGRTMTYTPPGSNVV